MDLKQKYIKDSGYDVYDEYLDALDSLDFRLSLIIENYVDSKVLCIQANNLISQILGGVVNHNNENVFFALEIIKVKGSFLMLSDLQIITSDEYLDLINLKSYIK